LLAVLIRYDQNPHSELLVLDAQHINEGPIATVYLPFRLHTAVHGDWVAESVLNSDVEV
jgi:carotenoid cleavage dioxygenase-like enzyme